MTVHGHGRQRRLVGTALLLVVWICLSGGGSRNRSSVTVVVVYAKSFEEIEATFEAAVNFHKPTTRELLETSGITVIGDRQQHEDTNNLPYYVHYQVGWTIESVGCVGWRPTLLMTCSGSGRPVLTSRGPKDTRTDCAQTNDAIACMMPIVEDNSSLASSLKIWETMAFQCRGQTEEDLMGSVGFRAQQLSCNSSGPSSDSVAKQGLKLEVVWNNNVAYSFRCKTTGDALTVFSEKGHCVSTLKPDDSQSGDSGSPYATILPKRFLTQIEDFFTKNPDAISKSAVADVSASHVSDSVPITRPSSRFVGSS